jgi:hypothetical protein
MTGYDKLARLVADYPDLTIYRRFGVLSAKILLFMQAELVHLERNLEIVAHDDRKDPARSSFESSWAALFGAPSGEGADLQSRKITEIQDKLSNYRMRQGNWLGCRTDWLSFSQRPRFFERPKFWA